VGEQQNQPFQLSFNSSLKVDFQGSRVTSDGGLSPASRSSFRIAVFKPHPEPRHRQAIPLLKIHCIAIIRRCQRNATTASSTYRNVSRICNQVVE